MSQSALVSARRADEVAAPSRPPPTMPVAAPSFVLIDDTLTFRELLKDALQRRLAPREVRDFTLGREGLESCLQSPPDLVIVDLYLPDMEGRSLIRHLRQRGLNTRIVVLTAHAEERLPAELVGLGVAGFLDKNSSLDLIERAVRRVLEGGMFFSASVPPPVPSPAAGPALPLSTASVLTPREQEVLRWVVRGFVSKEIGAKLELSTRTIEKHRAHILAKLGIRDLATLVRWGVQHGFE